MAHCLSLDMEFYKERAIGELIERIDGDVDALSNFFSQFVVNLLGSLILLIGILALLFTIDWRVGTAIVLFSLITFMILFYLRRGAVLIWREQRQQSATFYGHLSEWLMGTEDTRANGATAYILKRFFCLRHGWLPIYREAELIGQKMSVFGFFMSWAGSAIALGVGVYLWGTGLITLGTIYLIYTYCTMLTAPISEIQLQWQDLQQAEACILRSYELLNTRSSLKEGRGSQLPAGALSVTFDHTTFGYTPQEPVIQDITFHLQPGKVMGIIGRTGSGKTTLARLLFRLYDPQSGEIHLGGMPIQEMHLRTLRQHIGMITQDVQLFQASVRDNLTFFDRTISDERIIQVIEDVGLAAWYQALPHGLDTELRARGGGLSAGEAQLLAFARIFLHNPGLIIMDEASSRLDRATEKIIENLVDKLFNGRTAIIIAHRLSTLKRADDILVIENGHILEYGPRESLAQDYSTYFSQMLQIESSEVIA
ncbi:MAG TPA: ABC transporter ATP-binding protein, partial [Ktedonobacteraceae bacterium]|nr:ABC transporter ATP-binding protein [Ktedonobacteraceae bacterium]